jgi:hypothetical protein
LINDTTLANIIDQGGYFPDLVSSEIDKEKNPRTLPPDIGAYEAE